MTNRDFYNAFLDLVRKLRQNPIKVFNDALTYVLRFLSIDEVETPWEYGPEENEAFQTFTDQYLHYFLDQTKDKFWIDAWGDMYMDLAGKYKDFRGQFFTPPGMSDLAARISRTGSYQNCGRVVINDCACGSARMLLAAEEEAYNHGDPQPYLIGEDIDGMCCKMAAINMAVHGCLGEIIRHDALRNPDELSYGYLINETLAQGSSFPSIRTSSSREDFKKFRI